MLNPDIPTQIVDTLSAGARQLLELVTPFTYGELVVQQANPPPQAQQILLKLTPANLFANPPRRDDEARCALAGLWLLFDALDESHRLAQDVPTPSGSFWHAIMHRREGDFSNSKYWYARCASHPAVPLITSAARPLIEHARLRAFSGPALVDLVEQVADQPQDPRHPTAVQLQKLEWRMLFEQTVRAATVQP